MTLFSAAALLLGLQAVGWTVHPPLLGGLQGGAAKQPAATRPLAANEVLLELGAMGMDSSPADLAELTVTVNGRGKSAEAARAEHDAELNRIKEAAQAAGVAAADIEAGDVQVGTDTDAPFIDLTQPMRPLRPGASAEATDEAYSATSTVKLRIRNVERVEALGEAVEKAGGESVGAPQFSAEDTAAARQGARRKAIAQARADAEAYAAALNMRIVRILRVTERTGTDMMTMMLSAMSGGESRMMNMFEAENGRVPSVVFVGIDFVMAPR